MKSTERKRFYRVKEAAEVLNCSTRTVYRLIDTGELLAFRIRSSLRVSIESIDEYIRRQISAFQENEGIFSMPTSPGSPADLGNGPRLG